jgi:ribulose-phosphate 3-epimerase
MPDAGAPRIAVAVHELPLLRLGEWAPALDAVVQEWYFAFSDGGFAPGPLGNHAWLEELAGTLKQPVYAHLQVREPDRYIERLAMSGCRGIIVPQESAVHVNRTLNKIAGLGLEAGISVCAATPLTQLDYPLDVAARVVVHATEPSAKGGERFIQSAYERVRILAENLRYRESRAALQVTGDMNVEHAARMHKFGARVITLGRDVFAAEGDPAEALAQFIEDMAAQRHLV